MALTATITLTDFLLARIADDEAVAQAAASVEGQGADWQVMEVDYAGIEVWPKADHAAAGYGPVTETTAHIARHDPARVLAECAAKRAIVALHVAYPTPQHMVYGTIVACSECGNVDDSPVEWPCLTLHALATVYADHPDYRAEWAA